jgi:hypothetical protein
MKWRPYIRGFLAALMLGLPVAHPALAQITNAMVSGVVADTSGAAIPGATVILVSASRGTETEGVTADDGRFVFPTVEAGTYLLRVTLTGFKTLERPNIVVSPGDRLALGTMAIAVGAVEETVTVVGEAPLVQSQSGERSFSISVEDVQAIAVNGRGYNTLMSLVPGVVAGTVNGLRANQNTYQIDGISSVDTGNNSAGVTLSVDAVQEIKVMTTSYQAEYGRSAGAQVTAVTKSGTSQFHGSAYWDRRKDDLNANDWLRKTRGLPKQKFDQSDEGYTFGGPIGRPGSSRFFFFVNQEFQHVLTFNAEQRVRVPTELERRGDFSQTLDNGGRLFNTIRDPFSGLPCTAADTRGCFQDGGVLGRIPQNRLYDMGVRVLNLYPTPNNPQTTT